MNLKRKAAFLGIVLLLAIIFSLPVMRDEAEWSWAKSRDQAADYAHYLDDWPHGRHVTEARAHKEQREWSDTKRAMISEALKKHAAAQSDPDAIREKKARKERFFWKEATVENTLVGYQDYLQRYPDGEFANEARHKIDDLTRQAGTPAAASQ